MIALAETGNRTQAAKIAGLNRAAMAASLTLPHQNVARLAFQGPAEAIEHVQTDCLRPLLNSADVGLIHSGSRGGVLGLPAASEEDGPEDGDAPDRQEEW